MFIPKLFEIHDKNEIKSFIKANAFGQLISRHENRMIATHIPFLPNQDCTKLLAHIARQNPQWQSIADQEVFIILAGAHDYISPSWYSTPSVPTWNYQAVHVYGKANSFTDTAKLKTVVTELSHQYESSFTKPWQVNYKEAMLNAIVGIEIDITEIQCKYKLSQNRPAEDRQEIIRQLEKRGSSQLAKAMARYEGLKKS